jgi:hypothetical protein
MADIVMLDRSSNLERTNFFPLMLLTEEDMRAEQEYFREKQRRHNRFLHGWGTVCGLECVASTTDQQPWRVKITPGYALSPIGDEIYVEEDFFLDLATTCVTPDPDPCEPDHPHLGGALAGTTVYVAIRYDECFAKPVKTMPDGCGCEEDACEYTRIRDSFQVACLRTPPALKHGGPNLCDQVTHDIIVPCFTEMSFEDWVVLATVSIGNPGEPLKIDNKTLRRLLFSTSAIQRQVIECCCNQQGPAGTTGPAT